MRQLLCSALVTLSLLGAACGPDDASGEALLAGQRDSLSDTATAGSADAGAHGVGKVAVCHVPPGNPANAHTLVVGAPAVAAHLRHGDQLGDCGGGEPTDGGGNGETCRPMGASCGESSPCCTDLLCSAEGVCGIQID